MYLAHICFVPLVSYEMLFNLLVFLLNNVLSFDITGSLGSMSSFGTLYNEVASTPPDVLTW